MKRYLFIILIINYIIISADAQDVTVKAAFDSSKIFIGDQINYNITIEQPANLKLNLKILKDTLCKNIEIISGPKIDSIIKGDRLQISARYLVTSFDSGFYQVLPYFIESKNEQGLQRYYSDYSPLEVMRVHIAPADTSSKIFDIIEPYKAPLTVGEVLPWILICLLVFGLTWFLYKYLKTFKRTKITPEVVINPDPAHIVAFRELEKLKEEKLWQSGEVKLYYSKLTEILRQYLESRYGVYSLELTTSETLDALTKKGFRKDELYNQLKAILTGADLVKFAKHKPEADENERHFENSWLFVEKTKLIDKIDDSSENMKEKEVKS